jgi:1,4-alpha-glucan branching enzyme
MAMNKQTVGKKKVTFSFVAPDAKVVSLAGSFTNWNQAPIQLKQDKAGVWKKTLTLEPGQYEYRLLVDGQWQDDPQCDLHVPNQFGTQNCLRVVA